MHCRHFLLSPSASKNHNEKNLVWILSLFKYMPKFFLQNFKVFTLISFLLVDLRLLYSTKKNENGKVLWNNYVCLKFPTCYKEWFSNNFSSEAIFSTSATSSLASDTRGICNKQIHSLSLTTICDFSWLILALIPLMYFSYLSQRRI